MWDFTTGAWPCSGTNNSQAAGKKGLKRDPQRILIRDYSVDRSEAENPKRWLPVAPSVSSLFIDTIGKTGR
jgi:hypothetical protein